MWTGDNNSTWLHLKMSLSMVLSLGLSGEPFAGSDIGGFTGAPSGELYTRWLQSATLIPFFRTHSAIDTPRREPWSFGSEYERANRATIRLRYRLLPAIYTAFREHVRDGSPVVRPVFWDAIADTTALDINDEYLLGDHLLVAPVVDSAQDARKAWLPRGRWYRLGSDSAYDGGATVTLSAPRVEADRGDTTGLVGLPVLARAGAVIPMEPVMAYEGAKRVDTLALHVFPGNATSDLYEDAGDGYDYERGQFRLTTFHTETGGGRVAVTLSRDGSYEGARTFAVTVHAVDRPSRVTVDGRSVPVRYDATRREATFAAPSAARRIEVATGAR
jgi:alpha-glucosidase